MADVQPGISSGAAGTEVQTIDALRRRGHEVDAVWADALGRQIRHGNLHYLIELPRAYRRELRRAFTRASYDVVHVNQPHGFLAARWLQRSGRRAVFIHRSHGLEPRFEEAARIWSQRLGAEPRPLLRRLASAPLARALARHDTAIALSADGHIVSCSADAEFLATRLYVAPERIAVIPQAAPDAFLLAEPGGVDVDEVRLRTVLYVGQFAPIKAPGVVAEAMNRIALASAAARFIWVCDLAHHERVRALLRDGAAERVELRPWMPQEQLREVYDSAGIFLFPSFEEGFGKAFLEAMSRGCCVVATRAGGMRDVITDGVDGSLVEPGDATAVARAALDLMNDAPRAAAMGRAAATTAATYTWDRVAWETEDFYARRHAARFGT